MVYTKIFFSRRATGTGRGYVDYGSAKGGTVHSHQQNRVMKKRTKNESGLPVLAREVTSGGDYMNNLGKKREVRGSMGTVPQKKGKNCAYMFPKTS